MPIIEVLLKVDKLARLLKGASHSHPPFAFAFHFLAWLASAAIASLQTPPPAAKF